MNIAKDTIVTLVMRMRDSLDHPIDETGPEGLDYLHGHDDIFPKVEAKLEGKKPGDTLDLYLEPEDAFGQYDENLVQLLPLERLGGDAVPGLRYEGIPGEANDGHTYTVTDVAEGFAVLDGNHPLAGMSLRLAITVKAVRPATKAELEAPEQFVPDFLSVGEGPMPEREDDDDGEDSKARA